MNSTPQITMKMKTSNYITYTEKDYEKGFKSLILPLKILLDNLEYNPKVLFVELNRIDDDNLTNTCIYETRTKSFLKILSPVEVEQKTIQDVKLMCNTIQKMILASGKLITSGFAPIKAVNLRATVFVSCKICKARFSNKSDLVRHIDRKHPLIPLQICPFCERKFLIRRGLAQHISMIHSGGRDFGPNEPEGDLRSNPNSNYFGESFTKERSSKLKTPEKRNSPEPERTLPKETLNFIFLNNNIEPAKLENQCFNENQIPDFETKNFLDNSLDAFFGEEQTISRDCDPIKNVENQPKYFPEEEETWNSENVETLKNSEKDGYFEENDFNSEENKVSPSNKVLEINFEEPNYCCCICNEFFNQEQKLLGHLFNHHRFSHPFTCEVCFLCFGEIKDLQEHVQIHGKEIVMEERKREDFLEKCNLGRNVQEKIKLKEEGDSGLKTKKQKIPCVVEIVEYPLDIHNLYANFRKVEESKVVCDPSEDFENICAKSKLQSNPCPESELADDSSAGYEMSSFSAEFKIEDNSSAGYEFESISCSKSKYESNSCAESKLGGDSLTPYKLANSCAESKLEDGSSARFESKLGDGSSVEFKESNFCAASNLGSDFLAGYEFEGNSTAELKEPNSCTESKLAHDSLVELKEFDSRAESKLEFNSCAELKLESNSCAESITGPNSSECKFKPNFSSEFSIVSPIDLKKTATRRRISTCLISTKKMKKDDSQSESSAEVQEFKSCPEFNLGFNSSKCRFGTNSSAETSVEVKKSPIEIDSPLKKAAARRRISTKRMKKDDPQPTSKPDSSSCAEFKLEPNASTEILECEICERTLNCKRTWRQHMFFMHDVDFDDSTVNDLLKPSSKDIQTRSRNSTSGDFTEPRPVLKPKSLEKENDNVNKCNQCGEVYVQITSYFQHRYDIHGDDSLVHVCENCSKVLVTVSMVNSHLCTNVNTFSCKDCGIKFINSLALKEHNTMAHFESLGPHVCCICKKCFLTNRMLQKHKLVIHSEKNDESRLDRIGQVENLEKVEIKTVDCSKIERTKKRKIDSLICPVCKFVLQSIKHLKAHLMVNHSRATDLCLLCNKLFAFGKGIRHLLDFHIVPTCSQNKDYELSWEGDLKKDVKEAIEVLGEKRLLEIDRYDDFTTLSDSGSFQCRLCPMIFSAIRVYRTHYLQRHDESCALCNQNFKSNKDFTQHVEDVHNSLKHYLWFMDTVISTIKQTEKDKENPSETFAEIYARKLDENEVKSASQVLVQMEVERVSNCGKELDILELPDFSMEYEIADSGTVVTENPNYSSNEIFIGVGDEERVKENFVSENSSTVRDKSLVNLKKTEMMAFVASPEISKQEVLLKKDEECNYVAIDVNSKANNENIALVINADDLRICKNNIQALAERLSSKTQLSVQEIVETLQNYKNFEVFLNNFLNIQK